MIKCLECGLMSSSVLNLVNGVCRFCGSLKFVEGEMKYIKKIQIKEMWCVVSERVDKGICPKLINEEAL